jgi:hypothetical protein
MSRKIRKTANRLPAARAVAAGKKHGLACGQFALSWCNAGSFLVSKAGAFLYRRITGELIGVEVTTGSIFQIGASKVLFQSRFVGAPGLHNPTWTPSADGKRFVGMIRTRQNGDGIPVTVLQNWQAGLKK